MQAKMSSDIEKWLKKDGVEFLKSIGIRNGQNILDFGCGDGHYTIPLAKSAGIKGRVYAFDKDRQALERLRRTAIKEGLNNIELIEGLTTVPLEDNSIDAVLCYDVLHYQKNRDVIYKEAYRLLKPNGLFLLYPKHHKDDYPLMELAQINLENIIKEVEGNRFVLKDKSLKTLLHDNYYNQGYILNFTPLDKKEK